MSLKQSDILQTVRNKLKTLYSCNVYLDEVLENFKNPCFFLKLLKVTRAETAEINFNDCTLYITYFAEKRKTTALELYDIKDNIINNFWNGLQVKDRYIKFKSISAATEGKDADIINIDLTFEYFDSGDITKADYMIEKIHQNEKIKKE